MSSQSRRASDGPTHSTTPPTAVDPDCIELTKREKPLNFQLIKSAHAQILDAAETEQSRAA